MDLSLSRSAACRLRPDAAAAGDCLTSGAKPVEEQPLPHVIVLTRSIAHITALSPETGRATLERACDDLWLFHHDAGLFQAFIEEGRYSQAADHYHFAMSAGIARRLLRAVSRDRRTVTAQQPDELPANALSAQKKRE